MLDMITMFFFRDYYGCDAGCLDPPVKLGVQTVKFPVKLTDPLTAILYITGSLILCSAAYI